MPEPDPTPDNLRLLGGCANPSVDPALVSSVRDQLPAAGASQELAELFRMLGDGNRVRILLALLKAGELCVCDLAAVVQSSESTVSHALRLLRTAGVVRSRRDGRRIFYALDDAHVRALLDLSTEHVGHRSRPPATATTAPATTIPDSR